MARRLNRIWKSFFVVLGIGLLLTGAAAFVLYPQILKPPPKADYPAAQSTEEANLQDIDYLGRLIEVDRSFGPEAKAAFIAGVADLKSRAGSLSPAQLEMEAARLMALEAVYVQINTVQDEDEGPSLAAFLDGVVKRMQEKPVRNAIIDLRFNPGGDNTLTAGFTKALPEVLPPDGRIFILTSGNTYSAAISTAARLKYFGGDRALITGEPMGDREQFWAEGRNVFLPNSKLQVGYATAAHDWEHGCNLTQILTCHFVNYFIGVPAGKLTLDLAVVPRFADYVKGEDTVLLAIAAQQ